MRLVARSVLVGLLALTACGGSAPAPHMAEDKPVDAPKAAEEPEMRVEGQLGSIEPKDVTRSFAQTEGALRECHAKGLERIRFLGGEVKVVLRIGEDGHARYGWFEDTTLGDHETEMCMMHSFLEATWPKPRGGEAEVKSSFGFDPPSGTTVPEPRSSDAVSVQLVEHHAKINACKKSPDEVYRATAYVVDAGRGKKPAARPGAKPKKGKRPVTPQKPALHGTVLSVGIAPPGPERDEAVECLTKIVLGLKVESAKGPGKVTFSL
jgi:hypothetical protein